MAEGMGANPTEAHAGGSASAEAAARLRDLPDDFDEAIQEAKSAASPTPGVGGWGAFGDEHTDHMTDVRKHARDLAENIQSGAWDAAVTDLETSEEFQVPGDGPQLR